jgi:hypothetical protein
MMAEILSSELCNRAVAIGAPNWEAITDSKEGTIEKSTLVMNPMMTVSKPTNVDILARDNGS